MNAEDNFGRKIFYWLICIIISIVAKNFLDSIKKVYPTQYKYFTLVGSAIFLIFSGYMFGKKYACKEDKNGIFIRLLGYFATFALILRLASGKHSILEALIAGFILGLASGMLVYKKTCKD